MALKYGVPYNELYVTLEDESGLDPDVCRKGGYCDGGKAANIAQYHEGTFEMFKKEAIAQGHPFEDFQYDDHNDQIELTAWAFSQGTDYKKHWTAWRNNFGN